MAKVTGPLFSQSASGKFGDIVFANRKGQNIARVLTSPSNPNTPLQVAVRTNLGGLSKAYGYAGGTAAAPAGSTTLSQINRTDPANPTFTDVLFDYLTVAEADSWIDAQQFIKVNASRLSSNQAPIRLAP